MPESLDLGAGLAAIRSTESIEFTAAGEGTAIRFERLDGRVAASLSFAGRMRVDVSFQPGTVVREIDQAAREQGVDPNRWRMAVLTQLREWSGMLEWCEPRPGRLLAAIGALTHPLLGQVYTHDREPLAEVPRWALDELRCPDPMTAAKVLAAGANRRLARSLAQSLLSSEDGGCVQLGQLGLVVTAKGMITVDEMANVLEVPSAQTPERWPSVDDMRSVRQGLGLYPAGRRAPLLLDVARHHDGRAFAETMTQLWWVRDRAEHPLPVRLEDVREVCRQLVPVIAPPAARPSPPAPIPVERPVARRVDAALAPVRAVARPARVVASPAARTALVERTAPLTPMPRRVAHELPRAAPVAGPSTRVSPVPERWPVPGHLLPVHQQAFDGLHLTVPTSTVELKNWGRRLHNCLGDYTRAMAEGKSWLVGVERDTTLIGCVEIVPASRTVRQALGLRNQPLAPSVYQSVMRSLLNAGVIRALPSAG